VGVKQNGLSVPFNGNCCPGEFCSGGVFREIEFAARKKQFTEPSRIGKINGMYRVADEAFNDEPVPPADEAALFRTVKKVKAGGG